MRSMAPEEYEALRRTERQRLILHYAYLIARWTVIHWRLTLPGFLLLLFLVDPNFGTFVLLALSVWAALRLGRGRKEAKPAGYFERTFGVSESAYEPVPWLQPRWEEIARQVGLTRTVYVRPDRLTSLLARFNGADLELDEEEVAPTIEALVESTLGTCFEVRMFEGQELKDYERVAEVIRNMFSAAGALNVLSIRMEQPEGTDLVRITLVTRDPLAEGRELTPTTVPPVSTLASVEVGMQEDGQPWRFPLAESHAVVGGVPGSGKSVFLNVLLAGVSQRSDVQIVGIDCAGGVELEDWSPRFSAFATDQDEALTALRALWDEHERRIKWLRAKGFKSLTNAGFTDEMPLYLCVIDEAAQLFHTGSGSKDDKARAHELIDLTTRLVTVARKTGIVVVLATQKPTYDTIPTLLRDNAQVKVSFRVTTEDAARAVLGANASSAVMSPTQIKRTEKGVAIAEGADSELTKVRSYYISEESDRAIARQYAHLARPLASNSAPEGEDDFF